MCPRHKRSVPTSPASHCGRRWKTHGCGSPAVSNSANAAVGGNEMRPSPRCPFVSDFVLASLGPARRMLRFRTAQRIFAVGDHSDSMFFINNGAVKLTVGSPEGKEAVTAILY